MSKALKLKDNNFLTLDSINLYPAVWGWDKVSSQPIGLNNTTCYCERNLTTTGWYRLFKISSRECVEGTSFILHLNQYYNSDYSSSLIIAGTCGHRSASLKLISKLVSSDIFSKVRVVSDADGNAFIDVYYAVNRSNNCRAFISGICSALERGNFENVTDIAITRTLKEKSLKIENVSNKIQMSVCAKFNGNVNTNYSSGAAIPFTKIVYDDTKGHVAFFSDGIIDIKNLNSDAKIKISINLWVWTPNVNDRAWLQLVNRYDNQIKCSSISSMNQNYHSLVISESIIPFEPYADGVMRINPLVYVGNNSYSRVDYGVGNIQSTITITLLNVNDDII